MINQEAVNRQAAARLLARRKPREARVKQLAALKAGKGFEWKAVDDVRRLARRAKRLGLFDLAGALLRDPEDTALGNRVLEQILGANNLLGVTFLSEGARMSRAVGRITLPVQGGTRLGTGFMVSSRVLMTNNHVLGDVAEAGGATVEFDFFEREDGTTGPVERYRLQPQKLFLTDGPLDFTVVAVEAVNESGAKVGDRGMFPLVGPSGKAVVGERVSVIQHPNGEPQKVTVHDNKVVDVDGAFLYYETDTMGGSSGSPVLNINWDLAALHHAAVENKNEGIRISAIVAKLREMLSDESTSVGGDPKLMTDLMAAGTPPPAGGVRPGEVVSPPGHPAEPARGTDEGPRINPDGSVSWTVPVKITLGVGEHPTLARTVVGPGVPPQTTGIDPDLQAAIDALEDTERRVYYSETKDVADRKAYYPSLDGLTKKEAYETLSQLLAATHHTTLSYKVARLEHLYPWIDRRDDSSRELRGIYSNTVFDALEVIRREVAMEREREAAIRQRMQLESLGAIDEAFLEALEAASPFNCEHVVPQSWFNKRKQPKADLHHLFTCEGTCNSFRGNRAYFDFSTEAFRDDCGESGVGRFEPKGGKGAVARATLYFLLRYPGDVADSDKEMPRSRLATLIKWAKHDKVDRWERHRNAEIFKVQGNRNPLIDFPELVDKIDFSLGWA